MIAFAPHLTDLALILAGAFLGAFWTVGLCIILGDRR